MAINITGIKAVSRVNGSEKLLAASGTLDNDYTILLAGPAQQLNGGPGSGELLDLSFIAEGERFSMKKMALGNHGEGFTHVRLVPVNGGAGKILYLEKPDKPLKRNVAGVAQETDLMSIISPIPWDENIFSWGMGIDVISGEAATTGVEPFTLHKSTSKNTAEAFKFIENESDYDSLVDTSASAQYNVGGLKANASAEYLKHVQYSKSSITLMASYTSQYGMDEAGSYTLNAAAQELMQSDPHKFRDVYGDYFVAGGKRASTFVALYVCETTSESSMESFRASFGAQAGNVFSAEGSSAFESALSQHGVSTNIKLTMEGQTGVCPINAPYTPASIIEALNWFKNNEEGAYTTAKLMHYSTIVPGYSKIIPVQPDVFAKVSILFQHTWTLRAKAQSCPKAYQAPLQAGVDEFVKKVEASKNQLITDVTLMDGLIEDGDNLNFMLDNVFARENFWLKAQECITEEPVKDEWLDETAGSVEKWAYGLLQSSSSAVKIECHHVSVEDPSKRLIRKEDNLDFDKPGTIIVGWEVASLREDGHNGSWKKNCDAIIGQSKASITVRSKVGRGYHWGVDYYYVNGADYQF